MHVYFKGLYNLYVSEKKREKTVSISILIHFGLYNPKCFMTFQIII